MKEIPETKIKLTDIKSLVEAGYKVLSDLREEAQAPVVKAKFLQKEIIAVYGQEAAKKFYDAENFKRQGAMPKPILKTLFGETGVQTLDNQAHHHRKSIFMDLMTPDNLDRYQKILSQHLHEALDKQNGQFELFQLAKNVLFKSVCKWSGIEISDLSEEEIEKRADQQISMISGAFTSPIDHAKGIMDRKKSESWACDLIEEARKHPLEEKEKEKLALYVFAQATDEKGDRLPIKTAAVELLNIIRPTLALTVWIALIGHALFSRKDIYIALKNNFAELQDSFIQELRRYYPFFPVLPAISLKEVEIDGYSIPKDSWVVLDLYGTNHDARSIKNPESFQIDRYLGKARAISYKEEYEMVAQGGGNFRHMHRCAGEWITLDTLRTFSNQLVNNYTFSVPKQDWQVPLDQFPTYPKSKALLFKE